MNYVWIGLAGGALAFAHCLGMCGGFALHLAGGPTGRAVLARQLLWHGGKTFTYIFLGAIAGFAGDLLSSARHMPWIQDVLAYVAGAFMILMGAGVLGILPYRGRGLIGGEGLLASVFRQFFQRPTPAAALVLGAATGFLPCPIVLAFLALAVHSGSVATGMAVMAGLGVGTAWSLLVLGLTGRLLTIRLRRWGGAIGGAVLVLLGTATVLRGTETFHYLLGCPPAVHQRASAAAKGAAQKPTSQSQPASATDSSSSPPPPAGKGCCEK